MTQRAVECATRHKSGSRFIAARAALTKLSVGRVSLNGDTVDFKIGKPRSTIGEKVLIALKQNGKIREDETGFSRSSIRTYKHRLRLLEWITVDDGVWIWTGPINAEWRAVNKLNEKRRK